MSKDEETKVEETVEETEETTNESGMSSEQALEADAASKETGENTHGVLSPDPEVGQHVPSDFVPPGAEVNPKTGAVIEDGTTNANSATPRPNLPESAESRRPEDGEEWAGNHTI